MSYVTHKNTFQEIPKYYYSQLESIEDIGIKKIYSEFKFRYLDISKKTEETNKFLLNYLSQFKFITCEIFSESMHEKVANPPFLKSTFCVEGECIIIKSIDMNCIQSIINKIKISSAVILIDIVKKRFEEETEEVINFCHHFQYLIHQNRFIEYTIRPIIAYLVRRFYYPSNYFKDQSFFNIDESNELRIKENIRKFLEFNDHQNQNELKIIENSKKICHELKKYKNESKSTCFRYHDFNECEFINLRCIYCNNNSQYYLVFHTKSLHIFLMKSFYSDDDRFLKREIDFCRKYKSDFFVPFYGFIKKQSNITGIIYKFMPNGCLDRVVNEKSSLFPFLTIIRLFAGLKFLREHELIHRDLKPSNILLDNNNVPYISDFSTIRNINRECDFSYDIGSILYISPEQDNGNSVSYSTDVYSFGLIIYFLFEKKNMFTFYNFSKQNILPIKNAPNEIQILYQKCLQYQPESRPEIQEIEKILCDFFTSSSFVCYLINNYKNICIDDIVNFIYEISIHSDQYSVNNLNSNFIYLLNFVKYYFQKDIPTIYNNIGYIYYAGIGVKQDHQKAIYYYEQSIKENNFTALVNLGILYLKSPYVKDYAKALFYFEKCASYDSLDAFYHLGKIYYKGYGVKSNFLKAKEYFEKAAKQNHIISIYNLGKIYLEGIGVKKDYVKAKKYFEEASLFNHSDSFYKLGLLYFYGLGVETNYRKAQVYLHESSKINPEPFFYLGFIYETGRGVKRDLSFAIKLYSACAETRKYKSAHIQGSIYYIQNKFNKLYYRSNNDLGLIYLTEPDFQNFELGIKYIKEAGFNEYPYAQNNLGILYQYHFNDIENAKYFYEKASKNNFSLAEFNLGMISEMCGEIEESIDHYLKALECENEPLKFHNFIIYDERLELSKLFIISLINLKLTEYYLSNNEQIKAMIHFARAILKLYIYLILQNANYYYSFQFESLRNRKMTNIDSFFMSFPLFNKSTQKISLGWQNNSIELNQVSNMSCIIEKSEDCDQKTEINNIQMMTKIIKRNIEKGCFQNITSLKEIAFPSSLKEITIPSSVKTISNYAFYKCSSLCEIHFTEPSSLLSIGSYAFKRCSNLKEIIIPYSVNSINEEAFKECTSLQSVKLKSSMISILDKKCFNQCLSLKEIIIPQSLVRIDDLCFEKCVSLEKIIIPQSVIGIDSGCFRNCTSLSEIVIKSNEVSIGESSFEGCTSLSKIIINSNIKTIGTNAFKNCLLLKHIIITDNPITKMSIPPSLSSIGKNAFYGCKLLTTIDLSLPIKSIEKCCFYNCKSLERISIPSSLEIIEACAFYGCSSLTNIEIPSSVTSIGDMAFCGCTSLKSITIPSSINNIGENAFEGCLSLDPSYSSFYKNNIIYNYSIQKSNSLSEINNEKSTNKSTSFVTIQSDSVKVQHQTFDTINHLLQNELIKIFSETAKTSKFKILKSTQFNENYNLIRIKSIEDNSIRVIKLPLNLYMIFQNLSKMKEEIHEVIQQMNKLLFQPPYSILFGRIKPFNQKNINNNAHNISKSFYEGFDIEVDDNKNASDIKLSEKSQTVTLNDLLQNNHKFTSKEIYTILLGIAIDMNYLHSYNIIYRYLNPNNILIDKNNNPLILCCDNDNCPNDETKICRLNSSTKQTEISENTQKFIAPELIASNQYDFKVDIYSFGIIMCEILTSNVKYPERKSINHFKDLQNPLSELICKCLSDNSKNRPTFNEIVEIFEKKFGKSDKLEKEIDYNVFDEYCRFLSKINEEEEDLDDIAILKRKADKGDIESIIKYSELLLEGEGVDVDKKKAAKYLKIASDKGNATAMNKYAEILKEENNAEYVRYYKMAADQEDLEAMNKYAFMLQHGKGVEQNLSKAAYYFKKAADYGDQNAMNNYAFMLQRGEGISSNKIEAAKYYQMSIEKGNSSAMANYAAMLEKGDGVDVNIEEAIRYYKMSADKGNSNAMNNLARILQQRNDTQADKELAIHYYKLAIDKGNTYAMNNYAFMLQYGDGIKKNKVEASKFYKMAADSDNTSAMYNYAFMLQLGDGIPVNKSEAIRYYKMAADKGNSSAMTAYASMLSKGDGVPVNKEEAIRYYKMAIEKGNSSAMYNYASMLNEGDGVPVNKEEAIRYYKMAIDKGNSYAMTAYASMLSEGDGVPVNKEEAIRYYKMAADKGNSYAMTAYASMLSEGDGVPMNKSEAVRYYKRAADKGNSSAMYNYASILNKGFGVPMNKSKAIRYYKMAIEKGNSSAMTAYASMLSKGDGVPVNKEEAIRYYKMAIDKGNSSAMYNYASMLNEGDGVPVNKEEAIRYYKMAIDKGNSSAMYNYASMLNEGDGVPMNKSEAIRYYKMAIEKGNSSAMTAYASMLSKGDGVPMNKSEAIRYYNMAIEKGNSSAMIAYASILSEDDGVPVNKKDSVWYYKMAADKGNSSAMYNYASMLNEGDGVPMNKSKAIRYYKMGKDKELPLSAAYKMSNSFAMGKIGMLDKKKDNPS